jgi:hypothetical protein
MERILSATARNQRYAAGLVLRHQRSMNFQIFKKPASSLPYSQQPIFRILNF